MVLVKVDGSGVDGLLVSWACDCSGAIAVFIFFTALQFFVVVALQLIRSFTTDLRETCCLVCMCSQHGRGTRPREKW